MSKLNLVLAPDEIYSKISTAISNMDQSIIDLMDQMVEFVKSEHAYGVAAPMFGISKRIIVINIENKTLCMVNPIITYTSEEKEKWKESSLSFLGAEVEVERPVNIKVEFLNYNGQKESLEADGILARCIQHEIDYLDGKNILNYVSNLKRSILVDKMRKLKKKGYIRHVHSSSCSH
ncbi:MAG: peptide deformylase [Alphaproteobacteria bacterium]